MCKKVQKSKEKCEKYAEKIRNEEIQSRLEMIDYAYDVARNE